MRLFKEKTLNSFSLHNIPTIFRERESYSSFSKKSLQSLLLPFSYCYTLRGDLYPNTTHTYSECRQCFGAQKALGICQDKPVRLGGAVGRYCWIQITSENKTPKNSLVAKAWRFQVLWVDQTWRVFLVSLYSSLFTSGLFRFGELQRGFLPSSLVSSSITHRCVILGLLFFYPLPCPFQHCTYLFIHVIVECFD